MDHGESDDDQSKILEKYVVDNYFIDGKWNSISICDLNQFLPKNNLESLLPLLSHTCQSEILKCIIIQCMVQNVPIPNVYLDILSKVKYSWIQVLRYLIDFVKNEEISQLDDHKNFISDAATSVFQEKSVNFLPLLSNSAISIPKFIPENLDSPFASYERSNRDVLMRHEVVKPTEKEIVSNQLNEPKSLNSNITNQVNHKKQQTPKTSDLDLETVKIHVAERLASSKRTKLLSPDDVVSVSNKRSRQLAVENDLTEHNSTKPSIDLKKSSCLSNPNPQLISINPPTESIPYSIPQYEFPPVPQVIHPSLHNPNVPPIRPIQTPQSAPQHISTPPMTRPGLRPISMIPNQQYRFPIPSMQAVNPASRAPLLRPPRVTNPSTAPLVRPDATNSQLVALKEMFTNTTATENEKMYIYKFLFGDRTVPPCYGDQKVVMIKLNESMEVQKLPGSETECHVMVEILFEMNYTTGTWRRLKRTRKF